MNHPRSRSQNFSIKYFEYGILVYGMGWKQHWADTRSYIERILCSTICCTLNPQEIHKKSTSSCSTNRKPTTKFPTSGHVKISWIRCDKLTTTSCTTYPQQIWVSVCPWGYLRNNECDLCWFFLCMLPMAVPQSSSGRVTKSQGEGTIFGAFPPQDVQQNPPQIHN